MLTKQVILQRRKYGKNGVIYYQYRLTIPQKIVEIVGWDKDDKIELIIEGNKIICKNRAKNSQENQIEE